MIKLFKKIQTVLFDPSILKSYGEWCLARKFGKPRVYLPNNGFISEFQDFNEYLGTRRNIPSLAEYNMLLNNLQSGDTILDVGANIGQYTLMMGKIEPECEIHAFEPVKDTYSRLIKNLKNNNIQNAKCYNLAISDNPGQVEMEINVYSPATNKINARNNINFTSSVQCTTIDKFCEDMGIAQVEFLKVDVEGAEPLVLEGAKNMLKAKSIKRILIEICPANLHEMGFSVDDLVSSVRPYGYDFFCIAENGEIGATLTKKYLESINLENVLIL